MPSFIIVTIKLIVIIFAPIAFIGLEIARQEVSGDQYAAVLEIFGTNSRPGTLDLFGADIQTLASALNLFQVWSLPALIAIVALGVIGLAISADKLRATWHICLGLFFSFGLWATLITRSREAFTELIGSEISEISSVVMATYLSQLSATLLNLTGLLALSFGALALLLWFPVLRRKARDSKGLN